MDKAFARVEVESRAQWRAWLERHHRQTRSIWLVYWKKGDARHVPYGDLVEEALCFGWVDSLPRKLDAARSMLLVSPRRPGSAWSKLNKDRAERLIATGKMAAAGLAKIEAAKRDGQWTRLDTVDALIIPPDLKTAFASHPPAGQAWMTFPRSVQRGILEWILQAKRPETRARRILETAESAARGERAHQWRQQRARDS
jgi:uncharacterized protein YdeI (YjbR/CyaY-like superfamily)